jgi:cytochrome bd-type quinol oxidase subunit 1
MTQSYSADKHITLVAILHIVYHSLTLFVGIVLFALLSTIGCLADDPQAAQVLVIVGTSLAVFFIVLSVPGIIGGIGLLQRKEWGRIMTIVIGALSLMDIPMGTALGIYTFWALMQDDAVAICRAGRG